MSKIVKIIGVIVALIGIGIMITTVGEQGSGKIQIGSQNFTVPTSSDVEQRTPLGIIGAVIMFGGFGIIWLGFKV